MSERDLGPAGSLDPVNYVRKMPNQIVEGQFPIIKIYGIAITLAVTVEMLESLLVGTYIAIFSRIGKRKSLHRKGSWKKKEFTQ